MIPYGYNRLFSFPICHLRRVFPKRQDQQLSIIPQSSFRFMFVPSPAASPIHLPTLNGRIQRGRIPHCQLGKKFSRFLLLCFPFCPSRRQCPTKGPHSLRPAIGGGFSELPIEGLLDNGFQNAENCMNHLLFSQKEPTVSGGSFL